MLRGSCLCGAIAFELTSVPHAMGHCHCGMCRRQHGSAHSTYVQADAAAFTFVRGSEHVRDFASSPGALRRFCAKCGSKLTFVLAALPDRVWIAAGIFDDDPRVRPSYHIFVAAKADWYEIGDDLPRHAAYPG